MGLCTGGSPWRSLAWPGSRIQAKGKECEQEGGVVSIASSAPAGSTSVSTVLSQLCYIALALCAQG